MTIILNVSPKVTYEASIKLQLTTYSNSFQIILDHLFLIRHRKAPLEMKNCSFLHLVDSQFFTFQF